MSFLKKIWPQWCCGKLPGCPQREQHHHSCSGQWPSLRRVPSLCWLPRKVFYKDVSVHCLWIYVSQIPQAWAWWQSQAKDTSKARWNYTKEAFRRNPYIQTLSPFFCMAAHEQQTPERCILAGWLICLLHWLQHCFMQTRGKHRKLLKIIPSYVQSLSCKMHQYIQQSQKVLGMD